jgi:hypothetical protein
MGRHRPWLAAALAMLVAGLGHAYLRRWRRALLWFVAILAAGAALATAVDDPMPTDPTALPPLSVLGPLLVLYGVSAVDAFLIARTDADSSGAGDTGSGAADGTGAAASPDACPHCGKEVDPDLDFCTWCTEPLAPDEE